MTDDTTPQRGVQATRRTLVRGAAWSVPVVAAATTAPAFAVSPCDLRQTVVTNWAVGTEYVQSGDYAGTWTRTLAAQYGTTKVEIKSVPVGNIKAGTYNNVENRNFDVNAGTVSGLTRPLQFQQAPSTLNGYGGSTNRQDITITFTPPVENLRFSFGDIDSQTGSAAYSDRVEIVRYVSGTTTGLLTSTFNAGAVVAGNGSQGPNPQPFAPTGTNTAVLDTSNTANVNLSTPNSGNLRTSSISIRYWRLRHDGVDFFDHGPNQRPPATVLPQQPDVRGHTHWLCLRHAGNGVGSSGVEDLR